MTNKVIEQMYDDFVNTVLRIVAECIPTKTVVLGPKDPSLLHHLLKCC